MNIKKGKSPTLLNKNQLRGGQVYRDPSDRYFICTKHNHQLVDLLDGTVMPPEDCGYQHIPDAYLVV